MVERIVANDQTRVRFPSPAPDMEPKKLTLEQIAEAWRKIEEAGITEEEFLDALAYEAMLN